ncbi:MAG TPA: hypothetical protein PLE99_05575 [Candidatus Thiothrix moscowensis]|uniref:hypothetical protein n=1 Tax=unclassified Thiothrix TaxID=2636184 RepID=UPI0025D2A25D|nr:MULTISPECIES: hypothetical protein [unclassified Thiothrix]HRJ52213.1 hypothetical protein [Candidatus Thiothrix moscowensis]HRJ92528.1 hypothetical protein [Candidatus Thiothrix moscowensis]
MKTQHFSPDKVVATRDNPAAKAAIVAALAILRQHGIARVSLNTLSSPEQAGWWVAPAAAGDPAFYVRVEGTPVAQRLLN